MPRTSILQGLKLHSLPDINVFMYKAWAMHHRVHSQGVTFELAESPAWQQLVHVAAGPGATSEKETTGKVRKATNFVCCFFFAGCAWFNMHAHSPTFMHTIQRPCTQSNVHAHIPHVRTSSCNCRFVQQLDTEETVADTQTEACGYLCDACKVECIDSIAPWPEPQVSLLFADACLQPRAWPVPLPKSCSTVQPKVSKTSSVQPTKCKKAVCSARQHSTADS